MAEEHYDIYINSSSEKVKCNIIIFSDEILECRPEKETSGALFVSFAFSFVDVFDIYHNIPALWFRSQLLILLYCYCFCCYYCCCLVCKYYMLSVLVGRNW